MARAGKVLLRSAGSKLLPRPELSGRVPNESVDGAGEFAGSVFGDERVAVRDLDQSPLRKDFG